MLKLLTIIALSALCILATGCRQISQNKADLDLQLKDIPPTVTSLTITQTITNTGSAQTGVQTKAVPFDLFRGASASVAGQNATNVPADNPFPPEPPVELPPDPDIPAEPFPPATDPDNTTPTVAVPPDDR